MPRIEMTRTARIALFGLRVYLLAMMLLIAIKFIRDASRTETAPASASESTGEQTTSAPGERDKPVWGETLR